MAGLMLPALIAVLMGDHRDICDGDAALRSIGHDAFELNHAAPAWVVFGHDGA